ncbi:MAG: tetratricopeptide repeat protein [Anaerolineae bacterium]|nr:tetratricopeptide repeat protein [Anaerolineae bacterium]
MAKKKTHKQRERQSTAAILNNGLKAFNNGDYDQAIEIWERTSSEHAHAALAQAYFRRGLERTYTHPPNAHAGLADLERAHNLQLGDPCYAYHLGMAAHRLSDIDRAVRAYRIARAGGGEFARRAAYPLAVALVQLGQESPEELAELPLSDTERALLEQAPTFRRRPYTLSPDAPLIWQGMAALDAGDNTRAREALQAAIDASPVSDIITGLAHYYLGVLEARDENWTAVAHHWNATRASGLMTPELANNIAELYHRIAEERLESDAPADALAAAQEALRHAPSDKKLVELAVQALQRIGYAAASAGDWSAALKHWKIADQSEGGSFRLAYNLALAYERQGNFIAAAEKWREALRRRPRRDDHPDAISDEQVAQLWRRCSEAYSKAEEYDEAVRVCRHAVKWNPEHVDTRMSLAEVLMSNGQFQAAKNELLNVLERDPNHIPALLRIGEAISAQGGWWYWERPTIYWERVLALEPNHPVARQLMVDFFKEQALYKIQYWRDYAAAIEAYQQALTYQPENAIVMASIGNCHLRMGNQDTALEYIERAMTTAPTSLEMYDKVIHIWIDEREYARAWEVMRRAEAAVQTIPYEFYIAQAYQCCIRRQEDDAQPWLERAVEVAQPGQPVFVAIGEMAVSTEAWRTAKAYLERALAARQSVGQVHLLLGIIAVRDEDHSTAEKHWKEAENIARREHDDELMSRVQLVRIYYGGPLELGRALMRLGLDPEDLGFHDDDDDFFFEFDDEDEDDDDDFWF